MLKLIAPVVAEPVSLAEAKTYLKVEVDVDDALIAGQITAAREYAEHYAGRLFATRTLELWLAVFPVGAIELSVGPATSVESIVYTDASGAQQTLASSEYAVDDFGLLTRIAPAAAWPAGARNVIIRYVAGDAPQAARAAILSMLAHLYENRGDASETPDTVRRLLNTLKVY